MVCNFFFCYFVTINLTNLIAFMKIITFYSDKGGVGSTMLNVCVASHLAYFLHKKVCVIDTVGGFRNLATDRQEEVENIKKNIDTHRLSTQLSKIEYESLLQNPLEGSSVKIYKIHDFQELLAFIKKYKDIFDYVFIDVSGVSFENFQFIMKSHHIMLISTVKEQKRDYYSYAAFKRALNNAEDFNNDNLLMILNNTHFESPTFNEKDFTENPYESPTHINNMSYFEKTLYHRSFYADYSTVIGLNGSSDEIFEFCDELCFKAFGEKRIGVTL